MQIRPNRYCFARAEQLWIPICCPVRPVPSSPHLTANYYPLIISRLAGSNWRALFGMIAISSRKGTSLGQNDFRHVGDGCHRMADSENTAIPCQERRRLPAHRLRGSAGNGILSRFQRAPFTVTFLTLREGAAKREVLAQTRARVGRFAEAVSLLIFTNRPTVFVLSAFEHSLANK